MYQPASALGDPNSYREIFFEETQEHLANVEAILLRLQPDEPCQDDLNAIFRAVHSIKGSAAMLGCDDMAALAHLQENLLDLLRKDERPLEQGDIDALLKAGDTVQAQALRHRGVREDAPDSGPAEALLRLQLDRPRGDAGTAGPGPVVRRFAVRLAPLDQPIAEAELEMMLQGLAEMGEVSAAEVHNEAGGHVSFTVALEGTATDLRNVLTLLVAPELVTIDKVNDGARPPTPAPVLTDAQDELFVDPEEFRRKRQAAVTPVAAAPVPATPVPAADVNEPMALPSQDTGYIRVSTEKIDLLVNLVGELVITEAMLSRSGQMAGTASSGATMSESGLADLARHTRNLQEAVLAIRMLPMAHVFSRFARLVHELSVRLGKRVELKFAGESTELDRGLIEKISDPLTHLIRNAIDHGLESPQTREAAGKPATGTLRLRASQRGGNVVIEVSDDGRGLDRQRILAQAARRGIHLPADAPDEQVWPLIFEAGLSTAEQVTDLSGRGVGMDVVRRNIQALGGTIDLFSTPGWGTTVTVSVPLTLAIIDAMIVAIGGENYVLPLATVAESLSIESGQIRTLPEQGDTLRVRDDYLPVLHLARIFPPQAPSGAVGGIAVIVEADGSHAALIVDELVGQQQVVVKSLEANFRKVPGLSGATVMADGSVALILDVSHVVRMSGRHASF
ncbi:MAG: chemotaxis protein CheA [Ramlibacter sp.]|nr:chemotaxis protein CheA [Ramlibacter sp.]